MATPTTRRQLLGAAGMMMLGSSTAATAARPSADSKSSDADVLHGLVEIELLAVFAYRHVVRSGVLSVHGRALAEELLTHEQAHARTLRAALQKLGIAAPTGPSDLTTADHQLAAIHVSGMLHALGSERDALRLLIALERAGEGAYFRAIGELASPTLLQTAAEIMGSEAQHAALLRLRLEHGNVQKAVPAAFVQGSS
jgi:hypothetical protein